MSMDYIRKTYDVPAKRGGRVRYMNRHGQTFDATIVAARGGYLRLRLDGDTKIGIYHPTAHVEYLP